MTDDEQIRILIERWVAAVQNLDLDGVVADHTADVVMYDVPPPFRGNRGIDEYRDSWPQFFEWLRSGAVFELEELKVVAGADVAFAYGLLRCGKPEDFAKDADYRLRLTVGLRKHGDRWVIEHEHHSYPIS
jgi:ketosteroid isomerase-like protein